MVLIEHTGRLSTGVRYEPPLLSEYFRFPGAIVIWSIIPALAEEIAWRGYLQPRFIQLYGLARGIFFTGIVWGAFHFTFDFGPFMGHQEIILVLLRRLTMAVTLSVILGWITLRSGSVLPAAVVHGLYNAFWASVRRFPWNLGHSMRFGFSQDCCYFAIAAAESIQNFP